MSRRNKSDKPQSYAPWENWTSRVETPAKEVPELEILFDDNKLVPSLYGQHDQNIVMLEQCLDIEANARGNQILLRGSEDAISLGRQALELLYERVKAGEAIVQNDIETTVRMLEASAAQLSLPSLEAEAAGTANREFARIGTRKRVVGARTPSQDAYLRAMEKNDLIFGIGPAGTGKTFLAVAYAASLLERGAVDRLILSRPAVEAGERLGFLPGDMREKIDPYLRPLYDALYEMMPPERVERGLASGMIEVAPLAFMRGRTLSDAIVILDEAQNTTAMQMKMFLTRLGENSKMIVTGDPSQVDLPRGDTSGLVEATDILKGVDGIAQIAFSEVDVVRHPLVARIVNAYQKQGL